MTSHLPMYVYQKIIHLPFLTPYEKETLRERLFQLQTASSCKWLYQWRRDFFSDGYPRIYPIFLSPVTYLWERKDFPSAAPDGTLYAARNAIKLFHSPHITHSAPPCAPTRHASCILFRLGNSPLLWQWLPPSTANKKKSTLKGRVPSYNVIYFSENRKRIRQD